KLPTHSLSPALSLSSPLSLSSSLSLPLSLPQEEQNRGKPNWEHLNEDLHVLITVEDTQSRAEIKMRRAVEEVKKLLVPAVSTPHIPLFLSLSLTHTHTHTHTQIDRGMQRRRERAKERVNSDAVSCD